MPEGTCDDDTDTEGGDPFEARVCPDQDEDSSEIEDD